jgi:VanZ family protein
MITYIVSAILFVTISPSTSYVTYQYSTKLKLSPLFQGDIEYIINVLMYLILASLITFRLNGRIKTLFLCMGLSLIIELTQYLLPTGRMLSVTDFVLNTFGAVLGYLLMIPLLRYRKKKQGDRELRTT